jgi:hypothetical protein
VAEDPAFLAEVTSGLFFLNPPDREGKREALRLPAEMAGYRFESPAIVEDMLAHLERTPGALPLLQFAATRLWEKRDVARKLLSRASYDEMGGISGALATHADAVVEALPPASQALVRTLVLRLLTAERTRAIVPFDELAELAPTRGEAQRLIDHLVAARLLVVQTAADGAGGVATVELVHESLVTTWPTLRRWLDENSEDVAFLDQLRVAAKQWHDRGRAAGLLWRGDAAAEAIRFARRGRDVAMADVQRAFLAAVVADATRADRRRRQVLITIGAVLVLLLIAAGRGAVEDPRRRSQGHRGGDRRQGGRGARAQGAGRGPGAGASAAGRRVGEGRRAVGQGRHQGRPRPGLPGAARQGGPARGPRSPRPRPPGPTPSASRARPSWRATLPASRRRTPNVRPPTRWPRSRRPRQPRRKPRSSSPTPRPCASRKKSGASASRRSSAAPSSTR